MAETGPRFGPQLPTLLRNIWMETLCMALTSMQSIPLNMCYDENTVPAKIILRVWQRSQKRKNRYSAMVWGQFDNIQGLYVSTTRESFQTEYRALQAVQTTISKLSYLRVDVCRMLSPGRLSDANIFFTSCWGNHWTLFNNKHRNHRSFKTSDINPNENFYMYYWEFILVDQGHTLLPQLK